VSGHSGSPWDQLSRPGGAEGLCPGVFSRRSRIGGNSEGACAATHGFEVKVEIRPDGRTHTCRCGFLGEEAEQSLNTNRVATRTDVVSNFERRLCRWPPLSVGLDHEEGHFVVARAGINRRAVLLRDEIQCRLM